MAVEVKISETTLPTGMDQKATRFSVSTWSKTDLDKPRALVFISHGYAEYLVEENYGPLARDLAMNSCLVVGHDHLGHGRTEGDRAQVRGDILHDFALPIVTHCQQLKEQNPDIPLFIIAHSMGGLFALLAYFENNELFDGMVLYAPCIEVDPSIDTRLNRFLSKYISPLLPNVQASGVDVDAVTRDENNRKRLKDDPLQWHGGIKLRFGHMTLKALENVPNRAKEVKLPVLMVQGDDDKIVRPVANHKFFENMESKEKKLIKYSDAYHGLLIDLEDVAQKCKADIVQWINERVDVFYCQK